MPMHPDAAREKHLLGNGKHVGARIGRREGAPWCGENAGGGLRLRGGGDGLGVLDLLWAKLRRYQLDVRLAPFADINVHLAVPGEATPNFSQSYSEIAPDCRSFA
jgi:hypothetical protein